MTFIHHYFGSSNRGKRARNDNDNSERAKRYAKRVANRASHRHVAPTFDNLPTGTLWHVGKIMASHDALSPRNLASFAGTNKRVHSVMQPIMKKEFDEGTRSILKRLNEAKRVLRLVESDDSIHKVGDKIGEYFRIVLLTRKTDRSSGGKTTVELRCVFRLIGIIKVTITAGLRMDRFSITLGVKDPDDPATIARARGFKTRNWIIVDNDEKMWTGDDVPSPKNSIVSMSRDSIHAAYRHFNVEGFVPNKRRSRRIAGQSPDI